MTSCARVPAAKPALPGAEPDQYLQPGADTGTDERLAKAIVNYMLRPGTNMIERAEVITAAHRMYKTGAPELLAAEKYRDLSEIAAGAREDGFDRSGGGSTAPWNRTPASEAQMRAMEALRAAHALTMRYAGARVLGLVLLDGLSIDDAASKLKIRNRALKDRLRIILGILAAASGKW